jgi:hypothetical protein
MNHHREHCNNNTSQNYTFQTNLLSRRTTCRGGSSLGRFEPESPGKYPGLLSYSVIFDIEFIIESLLFVSQLQDNRIIVIYRYALVDSIDNSCLSYRLQPCSPSYQTQYRRTPGATSRVVELAIGVAIGVVGNASCCYTLQRCDCS